MQAVNLNLNDKIEVKLTEFGKSRYMEYYHVSTPPRVNSLGYTAFQLWEFMNIYGRSLYNGTNELPIEDNTMYIVESKQ